MNNDDYDIAHGLPIGFSTQGYNMDHETDDSFHLNPDKFYKGEPMADKDYIEHEVWVKDSNFTGHSTRSEILLTEPIPITANGYVKATLRIPKPERKVEITEGGLRDAMEKAIGYRGGATEDDLIKEIFGS